jgi:hypothetical protein
MTKEQAKKSLQIVQKMKQEPNPCPDFFCDFFWFGIFLYNLEVYLLLRIHN